MLQLPFFTQRLMVRSFRAEDQAALTRIAADRRFRSKTFPANEDFAAAVQELCGGTDERQMKLAICLRRSGRLIGGIVFEKAGELLREKDLIIDPAHEGAAYGLEARQETLRRSHAPSARTETIEPRRAAPFVPAGGLRPAFAANIL